jgi:hypothetical protein
MAMTSNVARRRRRFQAPFTSAGVALLAIAAAAGAAQAEPTAWTYNSKPTFAGTYQPPAYATYNSADGGKGKTFIKRVAKGVYSVIFEDLGSTLPSNLQIGAVGGSNFCTSAGWSVASDKKTVVAGVRCFTLAGAVADNQFTLLYLARSAPLGATGPEQGFVLATQPTNPNHAANPHYSYNSAYGANSIASNGGTGSYVVQLNNLLTNGGIPLVTALSATAVHCQATGWAFNNTNGQDIYVECFGPTGTGVAAEFSLLFTAGMAPGGGNATGHGAYAFASPFGTTFEPPSLEYQFNNLSIELIEQRVVSGAETEVAIPNAMKLTSGVTIVQGIGTAVNGVYCTARDWFPSGITIFAECYEISGTPVTWQYVVMFQAAP